jgi:hypothetical protein
VTNTGAGQETGSARERSIAKVSSLLRRTELPLRPARFEMISSIASLACDRQAPMIIEEIVDEFPRIRGDLDAIFYFKLRLVQYHEFSELLQPIFSPSSMHAA